MEVLGHYSLIAYCWAAFSLLYCVGSCYMPNYKLTAHFAYILVLLSVVDYPVLV
jgi:hypothetical protein